MHVLKRRFARLGNLSHLLGISAMAALMAAVPSVIEAQVVVSAEINGLVTDARGATLPSAKVTVANLDQHISQTAPVTPNGEYVFTAPRIGRYQLKVEAPGLKPLSSGEKISEFEVAKLGPPDLDTHGIIKVVGKPGHTAFEVHIATCSWESCGGGPAPFAAGETYKCEIFLPKERVKVWRLVEC